jgi:hypothetical protein
MIKRALIFLAAVLLFATGLGILGVLNSIPNAKEKRALAKIRAEEETLSRSFDVSILRSGFQRRSTGARDIYVPSLLVMVANSSPSASKPAVVRADFLRNGRTFCMAQGLIPSLKSGETCELWLKCIELMAFGSVAWGLSLAETTEGMDFVIFVESRQASVAVAKDKLKALL